MHVVFWLIAGGVVGWVAGLLMRRRDGVLLNIIIGIVGALLGGWFVAPFLGTPPSTRAPSPCLPARLARRSGPPPRHSQHRAARPHALRALPSGHSACSNQHRASGSNNRCYIGRVALWICYSS